MLLPNDILSVAPICRAELVADILEHPHRAKYPKRPVRLQVIRGAFDPTVAPPIPRKRRVTIRRVGEKHIERSEPLYVPPTITYDDWTVHRASLTFCCDNRHSRIVLIFFTDSVDLIRGDAAEPADHVALVVPDVNIVAGRVVTDESLRSFAASAINCIAIVCVIFAQKDSRSARDAIGSFRHEMQRPFHRGVTWFRRDQRRVHAPVLTASQRL